jgi:ribosomal-protein-alanine acetyltransferase
MTVMLRGASTADLEEIMALEERLFVNDAWSRETMRLELASPYGLYLAAVDETDSLLGYAGAALPVGGDFGEIQTIGVDEAARGRGLGRALMDHLLGEARRRGIPRMLLEVRADNPVAQALYASLGFETIAVRPRYYQPDDVDALVQELVLTPPRTAPAIGQEAIG